MRNCLVYFLTEDCKNFDNKNYIEYYVYDNDSDRLFFHLQNNSGLEIIGKEKEDILVKPQIMLSEENCADSDFYSFYLKGV